MSRHHTVMEARVDELLVGLASCLCNELRLAAEKQGGQSPCFCGVLPGNAIAFDYCDEGNCDKNNGMAWSRLVGINNVTAQEAGCLTSLGVTVEIGVLRSAPMFDEQGNAPTSEEQLAASLQQVSDMGVLHRVITCCSVGEEWGDFAIGEYVPLGPEGGCVGGVWNATWTVDFG